MLSVILIHLHEVSLALEHTLKHSQDIVVVGELDTVVELPGELLRRHLVTVHRLEDDLLPRDSMLCEPDSAVPALAEMRFERDRKDFINIYPSNWTSS